MPGKVAKIIQTAAMLVLAGTVITANVVASQMQDIISIYLNGFGANFDNFDSSYGNAMCQEIENEGIVLLKNQDATLPLDTSKYQDGKIPAAVFGWGSTDGGFITSGSGSGGSADRGSGKLITFLGALEGQEASVVEGKTVLPEVEGRFKLYEPLKEMYSLYKQKRDPGDYWNAAYPFFNLIEPSSYLVEPLIKGASEFTDTALVVLSRAGGEGQDIPRIQRKYEQETDYNRTYLDISKEEEDMLALVKDNFDKVILIINSCNAMNLSFLDDEKIDAAISVSGVGQSGSVAIADVLTGATNPSGKLVDTFAYDFSTAATYANGPDCREVNGSTGGARRYSDVDQLYVDYAEGIYEGYRWYETADAEGFWNSDFAANKWNVHSYEDVVQFPFGYGKSYTEFEQTIVSKPAAAIYPSSELSVTINVQNVGEVAGKEVVELYFTPPYTQGGVEKSAVNLLAFGKTKMLNPGESQEITLDFLASDMKSYDTDNLSGLVGVDGGYALEAGEYKISLRSDAHNEIDSFSLSLAEGSEIDGDSVHNRFSGDYVVKGDVAIDGTDTGENILYLTRSDFKGTFPTPKAPRNYSSKMPELYWLNHESDTTVMPTQGKKGDLKLYDDNKEPNLDLILQLGEDYDDPKWDELLDEISVDELYGVVQGAGFRTKAIPSINKFEHLDLDGPSGLNQEVNSGATASSTFWTSFPVETAIAQTWNEDVSYRFGLAIGYEAYVTGVAGWYGPAANIHRSPFDGRNFEYYSEDPLLSGRMCAKTVEGATNNGLYAYVKHFAVNETELKREGLVTWLNEQSLREIYAKSFEIAVKEGHANAMMSGFNRVGATWTGANYGLCTGLLREEWGFRGSVISDYALEWEMYFMDINQGLLGGNDLWLNGLRTNTIGTIRDRNGATTIAAARKATKNMLFTYCNTMYRQSLYVKAPLSNAPKAEIASKAFAGSDTSWKWLVYGLDAITVIGIGVWVYFLYFHKGKKKEE